MILKKKKKNNGNRIKSITCMHKFFPQAFEYLQVKRKRNFLEPENDVLQILDVFQTTEINSVPGFVSNLTAR